jgi:oxygen-independent coproporphyrinogen-3 oxidase
VLAGVNRLSLGIQSFQDRHLLTLGRIHDRRQAIEAISSAVAACDNVSIDLMYALPGQRLSDSDADLSVALSFDIRHLSLYQLTIEENTVFGRMLPGNLPDDDTVETMEYQIRQKLGEAGFTQYETSAFAKDASKQCQHNLNYWLFGDYLGVGPGAHSKLHQENVTIRQMRPFSVSNYLSDGSVAIESWTLSTSDILTEIVMNAGRLTQGFHLSKLAHHARLPISAFEPVVAYAIDQGYWFRHQDHIRPTEKGKRFLNQLLFEMLPEQNK